MYENVGTPPTRLWWVLPRDNVGQLNNPAALYLRTRLSLAAPKIRPSSEESRHYWSSVLDWARRSGYASKTQVTLTACHGRHSQWLIYRHILLMMCGFLLLHRALLAVLTMVLRRVSAPSHLPVTATS